MIARITFGALWIAVAAAGELKPETVNAWDEYVRDAKHHMQERLQPDRSFLWVDEHPGMANRVRGGEVVVLPAEGHSLHRAPSGLIHHWIGATFIPDARIDDIVTVLRDYDRYKDVYHPHVLESKAIRQDAEQDQFSMLLMNKAVVVKTAVDSDYQSRFVRVDARRSYTMSETTRVQEVENYGAANERKLPPGQGAGYIWKIAGIARFEQRDGGVFMEVEAMALSRDIPGALRWMVEPVVKRVSRSSVATTLTQTQKAVVPQASAITRSTAGQR